MTTTARMPGFPRWTGARVTITGPTLEAGRPTAHVTVHLTRRALWWAAWRRKRRKGVPTRADA